MEYLQTSQNLEPKKSTRRPKATPNFVAQPTAETPGFGYTVNSTQLIDKSEETRTEIISNPPAEHPAFCVLSHISTNLSKSPEEVINFIKHDPFFSIYLKLRENQKDQVILPPSFKTRRNQIHRMQGYDAIDAIRDLGLTVLPTYKFNDDTDPKYVFKKPPGILAAIQDIAPEITINRLTDLHGYIKRKPSRLVFTKLLGIAEDTEFDTLESLWDQHYTEFKTIQKTDAKRNVLARKYLAILSILGLNKSSEYDNTIVPAKEPKNFKPQYEFETSYNVIDNVAEIARLIAENIKVVRQKILVESQNKRKKNSDEKIVYRSKKANSGDYRWPDQTDPAKSVAQLLGWTSKKSRPGCIYDITLIQSKTKPNPNTSDLNHRASRVQLGDPRSGFLGRYKTPGVKNSTCRKCPVFQERLCPKIDFATEMPEISKLEAVRLAKQIDSQILGFQKYFNWVIVTD
jgi:hypothetical protein